MSQPTSKLSRRTLFAGAGTATALAAATAVLPRVQEADSEPEKKAAPAKGGGYQLTEHVKRYYQTTRI